MAEEATPDPAQELQAMQDALAALGGLDSGGRQRAVNWLAGALGVVMTPAGGGGGGGGQGLAQKIPGTQPGDLGTPRQFMAARRPSSAPQRVTSLAYYLTHARNKPHFKTKDLVALNTEAGQSKIGNPHQAVGNAKDSNGFLAEAPEKSYQVTP